MAQVSAALLYFTCLVLPSLLLLRAGKCIRVSTMLTLGVASFLVTLLVVEVS